MKYNGSQIYYYYTTVILRLECMRFSKITVNFTAKKS